MGENGHRDMWGDETTGERRVRHIRVETQKSKAFEIITNQWFLLSCAVSLLGAGFTIGHFLNQYYTKAEAEEHNAKVQSELKQLADSEILTAKTVDVHSNQLGYVTDGIGRMETRLYQLAAHAGIRSAPPPPTPPKAPAMLSPVPVVPHGP